MADVSQTLNAIMGTDGRVKVHAGSPIIIAGVYMWKRSSKTATVRIPHFESPADANGTVQPNKGKGLGDNTVRLEGWYNRNATAATETGNTAITNGVAVALDLMTSKSNNQGYSNVIGIVSNFEHGQDVNDKVSTFSCDIEVDGVFPTWGTVT